MMNNIELKIIHIIIDNIISNKDEANKLKDAINGLEIVIDGLKEMNVDLISHIEYPSTVEGIDVPKPEGENK